MSTDLRFVFLLLSVVVLCVAAVVPTVGRVRGRPVALLPLGIVLFVVPWLVDAARAL